MRIILSFLTLVALAACSGAGPPSALPGDQTRAYFPAGGVVNQIEVYAVDRLALRSAELTAPDGHATPASSVSANPAPTDTVSQEFPTGPSAGAFAVGSIGSNALSPGIIGAAPQTQARLLAVVSTASIALPDPVAYRRDWQQYRIRLRFGQPPGEVETREIAAPQPPPGN
jgi:hypothetical protein